MGSLQHPDVLIAGAGIIGLSLALELHSRGARVTVLDRGLALAEASTAAAGMLAVTDPDNPPSLRPLSELSASLYVPFLARIQHLSGHTVPFQTSATLQQDSPAPAISPRQLRELLPDHNLHSLRLSLLSEHSIDPRQLAPALIAAVRATSIALHEHTCLRHTQSHPHAVEVHTSASTHHTAFFVDCTGAWASSSPLAVHPVKGQMLSVRNPSAHPLNITLRTHELYLVPRSVGPNAGRILIGATVEDAGFSKHTDQASLDHLHRRAADLLPMLTDAPVLDQWAGLRPATHDRLPILGAHPRRPRHLFATAHFRNGILLAPATAHVLADLITGTAPGIDLAPFSPARP